VFDLLLFGIIELESCQVGELFYQGIIYFHTTNIAISPQSAVHSYQSAVGSPQSTIHRMNIVSMTADCKQQTVDC
jgi:hypothetical protein